MAAKKAKRKNGRPLGSTEPVPQDIADEVVEWISSGQTMRDYCRQEGKPCRQTIDKWKDKDESFRSRIARARDDGFDVIAESCMEIADDSTNDWTERPGKDGTGSMVLDAENIQRSKLRIETRLKLLAKWDPRRYGDRQTLEHEGNLSVVVVTGVPQPVENSVPVDGEE